MFISLTESVYALKCPCGWFFPSLDLSTKFCPQCKIRVQFCINCGCKIDGLPTKLYCKDCKKSLARDYISEKRENKTYKETGSVVCDIIDCDDCPYDDCILPYDEDQGELF